MRSPALTTLCPLAALLFSLLCLSTFAHAQGYGPTDFLVADVNAWRIAVFNKDLVFQRYLDTNYNGVVGLDLLPNGNLVAVSTYLNGLVKQYNPAGRVVSSFTNSQIGTPNDISVGPPNRLYIPSGQNNRGVLEFTQAGEFVRQLGNKNYSTAVVLPGGILWAAQQFNPFIDIFDLNTGTLIKTFYVSADLPFANGHFPTVCEMTYSPSTNTVLVSDDETGKVYERTTDGEIIRSFTPPPGVITYSTYGLTRGPGGDVLALYFVDKVIVRWKADGTLVSSTDTSNTVLYPHNMVWAGNVYRPRSDFDADHKSDFSIWNPLSHNWYITDSSTGQTRTINAWSDTSPDDKAVPGDYDGDGRADVAIYRPSEGNWYIIQSSINTPVIRTWGINGDIPVPADYDGDGKTDIAVWRPSEGVWYIIQSSSGGVIRNWGLSTDKPAPADYDGDGKADIAVYRPSEGNWYIIQSNKGGAVKTWGQSGDKLVPADYDGDGKVDLAVFRPSETNWYILKSTGGTTVRSWGLSTDVPVPADFDGDGAADLAVFRPAEGTWYIIQSSNGNGKVVYLGSSGDVPVPGAYLPE